MAAMSRDDRHLMRQRGAGSRKMGKPDFGFDFGSQNGSREERQLMRQRGAGNRNIGNVDFGFSFGDSNVSRRKLSRTPQSVRRSGIRASQTPASRRSREPSTAQSARNSAPDTDGRIANRRELTHTPQETSTQGISTSKRRRLNGENEQEQVNNANFIRRRSSRGRNSSAIFRVAEDPAVQSDTIEVATHQRNESTESPLLLRHGDDKENQQGGADFDVVSKDNKRKSFNGHETRRIPQTARPVQALPLEDMVEVVNQDTQIGNVAHEVAPTINYTNMINDPPITGHSSVSDAASKPKKRKKKRKSVVLGGKKRRSSGSTRAESSLLVDESSLHEPPQVNEEPDAKPVPEETTDGIVVAEEHDTTAESSVIDVPDSGLPKRHRNRQSFHMADGSPTARPIQPDNEEEDETYIDEEGSPEPITPALKRNEKIKNKPRDLFNKTKGTTMRAKTVKGSSYPITTHRLTNVRALPTIYENRETHDLSEDESNPVYETFTDRTTPNAIDVLAQICRETITAATEKLETSTSRAELKRKRTALESFGTNLDERLFDMSEKLEYRLTLEARLRKTKRKNADLQTRWLEIKRQRDLLALKADAIRRQNWVNDEQAQQKWKVSELANRIEVEVERDDQGPVEDDLEFLLKSVAGTVSCASSGGGILGKIRAFNGRLERLVGVLEGR